MTFEHFHPADFTVDTFKRVVPMINTFFLVGTAPCNWALSLEGGVFLNFVSMCPGHAPHEVTELLVWL